MIPVFSSLPATLPGGRGAKKGFLLNALLAQAGSGSRALTSLELGIALADDVEGALALHDLAVSVAALHGCEGRKNFHVSVWFGMLIGEELTCRDTDYSQMCSFVKTNLRSRAFFW